MFHVLVLLTKKSCYLRCEKCKETDGVSDREAEGYACPKSATVRYQLCLLPLLRELVLPFLPHPCAVTHACVR